jgi:hypothetical protein
LSEKDLRPPVWVGHVVLETDRLEETEQFMRKIGMRSIVQRPEVAVLELRGGTHLGSSRNSREQRRANHSLESPTGRDSNVRYINHEENGSAARVPIAC